MPKTFRCDSSNGKREGYVQQTFCKWLRFGRLNSVGKAGSAERKNLPTDSAKLSGQPGEHALTQTKGIGQAKQQIPDRQPVNMHSQKDHQR